MLLHFTQICLLFHTLHTKYINVASHTGPEMPFNQRGKGGGGGGGSHTVTRRTPELWPEEKMILTTRQKLCRTMLDAAAIHLVVHETGLVLWLLLLLCQMQHKAS